MTKTNFLVSVKLNFTWVYLFFSLSLILSLGLTWTQSQKLNCWLCVIRWKLELQFNLRYQLKHVSRSFLVADLFSAVQSFDYASTTYVPVNETIGRLFYHTLHAHFKSLNISRVSIMFTSEKRPLIDSRVLGQAQVSLELTKDGRVPSENNPVDAMTKGKPADAIRKMINTNNPIDNAMPWVLYGFFLYRTSAYFSKLIIIISRCWWNWFRIILKF